ncbi:MAG TPA: hypothetical protein VGE24_06975 [Emticicia sp.]
MTYDKAKKIIEALKSTTVLTKNMITSIGNGGKWVDIQYKRIDIIETMALIEFCKTHSLFFTIVPMSINQLEITLFSKD